MAEIVATIKIKLVDVGTANGDDPITSDKEARDTIESYLEDSGFEVIGDVKVEPATEFDKEEDED